jgi:hypothetical protein
MKAAARFACRVLIVSLLGGTAWGGGQREGIGSVGGGIFRPTGSDADVAATSSVLQLTAAVGFHKHLGAEAEFLYVPIRLKDDAMPGSVYNKSSQIAAIGGIRISSGRLLGQSNPAIGYLSLRGGYARIVTKSNTELYDGEWIGRSVNELEDPGFGNYQTKSTQEAFVLSPKAGVLIRVSTRAAVDLCAYPMFIYDKGDVTRQFFVTASFAMAAWQDL